MAKNKQIKGALNYVGKLISTALLVLLVLLAIFLVYYLISIKMSVKDKKFAPKINLYTIVSGSMVPNVNVYDVVLAFKVNGPESIKVGDVITFKSTSTISKDLIVTHRVINIKQVNGKYEYVTKGDANPAPDSDTAKYDNVIGKVVLRFPQLGRLQVILASKMGWFIIVLLPASCVIIYDIIKLVKLIIARQNSNKISNEYIERKKYEINIQNEKVAQTLERIQNSDYVNRLEDLKEYQKNS